MKLNINNRVEVVLTDAGLEMYKDHYRKIDASIPCDTSYFTGETHRTDKELSTQLWSLFEIFHSSMSMTGSQVFEDNNITIIEGD